LYYGEDLLLPATTEPPRTSRIVIPYASSHFLFLVVAKARGRMFGFHFKTNISTDSTSLTVRQLQSLDEEMEINSYFIFQFPSK
jgi:hypothetical protein